ASIPGPCRSAAFRRRFASAPSTTFRNASPTGNWPSSITGGIFAARPPGMAGLTGNASRSMRSIRRLALAEDLMAALAEFLDHLGAEGGEIVGLAAGDQTVVDHDLAIDPDGAGILQVGAQ